MANYQSLVHALKSSTLSDVVPAAASAWISDATLNTAPSPSFITQDAINVPAGGFGALYAFGDSLSDAGNVSLATLGAVPTNSIYSDGRFTNGNVWVQDLAQGLGQRAVRASLAGGTDYAVGGAETGPNPLHTVNPTDLPGQLAQFVANVPNPSPNALYTVWAGSNDVLGIANSTETPAQQQASVQQAATNEAVVIDELVAHGAKDIVVMDVPDLSKTPNETVRRLSDAASGLSRRPTTRIWVRNCRRLWPRAQCQSTTLTSSRGSTRLSPIPAAMG